MKTPLLTLFALLMSLAAMAQEPKEILLIGTFHFNNPGLDMAKTKSYDILSDESQQELEELAATIAAWKPDHIITEWEYNGKKELDSLYQKYQSGTYFEDTTLSSFYRKGEIFQLAFRVADKAGIDAISGIDYHTSFPADSMLTVMQNSGQEAMSQHIMEVITWFSEDFNNRIQQGASVTDLLLHLNSREMMAKDQSFYTSLANLAGDMDNHVGAHLVSEWYRRNIFMLSFMQKQLEPEHKRVMVLLGASHVAAFRRLLMDNPDYRLVELKEIL